MTPAERAFYEWYNATPRHQGGYVPLTREIFTAGWDAATDFIRLALEPFEPAAEAERVAEVFDQAATDYATIEREQQ